MSIEIGKLVIKPRSGKLIPEEWLDKNSESVIREVLEVTKVDAYRYLSFSTGQYLVSGNRRAGGVALQFASIVTGESIHTVFNCELNRSRQGKKGQAVGTALPRGQFRVGKRSHFYRFWLATKLQMPNRLGKFYKHMGNLKLIIFTNPKNKANLKPVSISNKEIIAALRDKVGTIEGQLGDKVGTKIRDNKLPKSHAVKGIQPFQSACESSHGNKVISRHGNKPEGSENKSPEEQSHAEWWKDYDND